jgi:predicted RND superfamily exporter protein
VGTCLVVIFGFMGWLGAPVYLTTTVMPVILTVVGVADEIHIFGRFVWTARERPGISGAEAALATLDEMAVPVVKTSLTTMIGFLSFVLSPLVPVRAFGLATAGGVLFCMLFSLTVVPAVLALVRTSWLVSGVAKEGTREGTREGARLRASVFGALARTAARRRRVVIAVVLILASVLPFGIARVEVQDSWIDGFSPESGFYQATERFNAQFFGTHILAACIDARATVLQGELAAGLVGDHEIRLPSSIVEDPRLLVGRFVSIRLLGGPERLAALGRHIPVWDSWIESARREGEGAAGSIVATTPRYTGSARFIFQLEPADRVAYEIRAQRFLTPPVIEAARDFARFLAGHGDKAVGGVLGPADYLATTNFIAKRRDPEARELRVDTQRLQWLWEQYGRIRGEKRLREAVDPGFDRALVTAYLKNANFADTARLIAAIRAYEAERLAPEGIAVTLAGDVAVSQALIEGIARSQVSCLLLSLLGILAVTSVLERSLRAGLYCVIPPALAVLATFAFMGFADIPLGVATSMFSSMTLGIGVDYAIHILARHRLERARGAEPGEAARGALAACGPAITTDAVAVALGFGILTTSQVPANARLGLLTMLGIVTALLVSVILLPALLARRPAAGNPPRSSPPPPPPAGGRCGAG